MNEDEIRRWAVRRSCYNHVSSTYRVLQGRSHVGVVPQQVRAQFADRGAPGDALPAQAARGRLERYLRRCHCIVRFHLIIVWYQTKSSGPKPTHAGPTRAGG
ncbi:hypothetical protein EVAR_88050_1 [Eumeta japonica]|uniref:Uncharacterized protein n=1 Tax=Eumeta variegata TaxID=151549 RepID=A0A4C1VD55_EUMVA|nr:hypothetical protein EVAR_88050_1 [Eumeta japonica]